MDIEKIRNGKLTEGAKMDIIADCFERGEGGLDFDKVLAKGNTATAKSAIFEKTPGAQDDKTMIGPGTVVTSERLANGTATVQITSDGNFFLEYQPDQGTLTHLHIRADNGTPTVLMSDNMKAAFRTALGIE